MYRDTQTFSSDKTVEFRPKFGNTPLYQHHTTSLVFNDPPRHSRVRRLIAGALTPHAIAEMEAGLATETQEFSPVRIASTSAARRTATWPLPPASINASA